MTYSEQHDQPGTHDCERHRRDMAQRAVVELEVVEEAHLLVAAVLAHKLALVFKFVDTAALQRNPFVSNMSSPSSSYLPPSL